MSFYFDKHLFFLCQLCYVGVRVLMWKMRCLMWFSWQSQSWSGNQLKNNRISSQWTPITERWQNARHGKGHHSANFTGVALYQCVRVHIASSKPDFSYDEANERTRNQKCPCHLSSQSSLRQQTHTDCAASKPSIYLELSLSLLAHELFPTSPNLPSAQEKPALPLRLRNVFTFQHKMEYHLAPHASCFAAQHGEEYVPLFHSLLLSNVRAFLRRYERTAGRLGF